MDGHHSICFREESHSLKKKNLPQWFCLNFLKYFWKLITANESAALPSLSPTSPASMPPVIYKIGLCFCWHSGLCEVGIFFYFWLHRASIFFCFGLSAQLLSPHLKFPPITNHSMEANRDGRKSCIIVTMEYNKWTKNIWENLSFAFAGIFASPLLATLLEHWWCQLYKIKLSSVYHQTSLLVFPFTSSISLSFTSPW